MGDSTENKMSLEQEIDFSPMYAVLFNQHVFDCMKGGVF